MTPDLRASLQRDFPGYEPVFCLRGTAAIYLALKAVAKARGTGEVIVPSTVCAAVPLAVVYAGFVPRFCDVNPATFCMSEETLARRLGPRTRAIIAVHLFGKAVPLSSVTRDAASKGVVVIEDIAQAVGGRAEGRRLGTFGDFALFSYDDKKILKGKGGVLLVKREADLRAVQDAQAALPDALSPDAEAALATRFHSFSTGLFQELRREGLRRIVSTLQDEAEAYRALFLGKARQDEVWDPARAAAYQGIERERELRWRNYQEYARLLDPKVRYVRFREEEVIWRLPLLVGNHDRQKELVQRIRDLGALASDHYFPMSHAFGGEDCPQARAIGLTAVNLWVDSKADAASIGKVCELVNRLSEISPGSGA